MRGPAPASSRKKSESFPIAHGQDALRLRSETPPDQSPSAGAIPDGWGIPEEVRECPGFRKSGKWEDPPLVRSGTGTHSEWISSLFRLLRSAGPRPADRQTGIETDPGP